MSGAQTNVNDTGTFSAVRILYVDCDTLRPDHLGCYGYHRPTSPTVDALAAESTVFDRVHASDVPCLPSRSALFSGQMGIRTGVVGHAGKYARGRYPGDGHVTDPERYPLAMALSKAGYLTSTFTTFHQRHLAWRFCAGWDEVHRFASTIGDEVATELEGPAIEWLTRNGQREDWFLHLHFWDPHVPYNTPLEFGNPMEGYAPPEFPSAEELAEQQGSYGPMGAADLINDYHRPHPRMPKALRNRDDYRMLIDGYDVGIRYFDDTLGRIVDTLSALGILDDTVIILSSDHGENQGELNLYTSHSTADAITTRIPLVVRWPGVTTGTRSDALLYGLDLAPTLLDLLDIPVPSGWDGLSFAPAVRGEAMAGREELVFGHGAWFVQRAVLRDDWLYIRTLHKALDPMPDELLFDLRNDPRERHNLVASEPARRDALRGRLGAWWDEYGGPDADPLVSMAAEGGAYYPRIFKDGYLKVLRESGRDWAAKEIEERYIAPVPDRFDFDLR
jgi:arylsulfatase A-like enzyme